METEEQRLARLAIENGEATEVDANPFEDGWSSKSHLDRVAHLWNDGKLPSEVEIARASNNKSDHPYIDRLWSLWKRMERFNNCVKADQVESDPFVYEQYQHVANRISQVDDCIRRCRQDSNYCIPKKQLIEFNRWYKWYKLSDKNDDD
jgi:hypothetical protein